MKRPKKASNPTSIRWPGDVQQILDRWMKYHGLDRTHTACELIKYADSVGWKGRRDR